MSVWNLIYTCSRWCYMSSSSFTPIGALWPTLQPKIGHGHLSALMALKSYRGLRFGTHTHIVSVLIPTDFRHSWLIFGPLADKNTWRGVLLELPASEKFSGLFCTCFEISVWNLVYTCIWWCRTSSLSFIPIWTLWPTLQPKIRQSFICIHGLKNYIEASDLIHTLK